MKIRLFSLISIAVTLVSCHIEFGRNPELNGIEAIIQDHPDSAYQLIRQIDRTSLTSEEDRAHYALLYSIALDKNYIDVTEDSLIKVAVNYFEGKNDRNEFLSLFYQGRVYENAGRDEDAMKSYIKAGKIPEECAGDLYLCKLHFAKSRIYNRLFLDDNAQAESEKAAEYALKAGHFNNYARAVLDQVTFLILSDSDPAGPDSTDFAKADSCLLLVRSIWDDLSDKRKGDWYVSKIMVLSQMGKAAEAPPVIEEYLAFMHDHPEKVAWSTIAGSYGRTGRYQEMLDALETGISYGQNRGQKAAGYYSLLSKAYAGLGKYKEAFENYSEYVYITDEADMEIFNHDTKFLEERDLNELERARSKNKLLMASLIILISALGFAALLIILAKNRKQSERIRVALDDLQKEYDAFTSIKAKDDEMGKQVILALNRRMSTLKTFLEKKNKAVQEIDRLSGNRTDVLESIAMIYAIYAPSFTSVLIEKGLSPAEIGYCCLHLMGYSTKEAGDFICSAAYYNISSRIRGKLDIETNYSTLSKWLKDLYSRSS